MNIVALVFAMICKFAQRRKITWSVQRRTWGRRLFGSGRSGFDPRPIIASCLNFFRDNANLCVHFQGSEPMGSAGLMTFPRVSLPERHLSLTRPPRLPRGGGGFCSPSSISHLFPRLPFWTLHTEQIVLRRNTRLHHSCREAPGDEVLKRRELCTLTEQRHFPSQELGPCVHCVRHTVSLGDVQGSDPLRCFWGVSNVNALPEPHSESGQEGN